MELYFYIALLVILVILAASDLVVGVANDAVNFLNSAVGAKAAPFRIVLITAAAGILLGATFSEGMMEVARNGIFNPGYFYFNEIILIFLAVMLTDVLLLDLFNTLGLPTSTTVSIVFELLGAAIGISIIKISSDPALDAAAIGTYINSGKTLVIISGILLSVVMAFTGGALFQYISRIIFTFNYKKPLKYFGSIFGGAAITAITHFMLVKGAKGSSFINENALNWIQQHSFLIVLYSFTGWTILLQLLHWLFKVNTLKIVVLAGTFALAMAFAGNDLVNFIGVPLAGINAFKEFVASNSAADQLLMGSLAGKVQTPTLYLLIAGAIMVITLWTSKKARAVVKTSLNLSNQEDVDERFESSMLSRSIVRGSISLGQSIRNIVPEGVFKVIDRRFKAPSKQTKHEMGDASFDLIRATVNLLVASVLISMATSYKLPLSTTYVTFMVAMGSSFADGAWGRERAVYRITGVLTIIGGWFFTAISAFTLSALVALFIAWGGPVAISIVLLITGFSLYKSHRVFSKKAKKEETIAAEKNIQNLGKQEIYALCAKKITLLFEETILIYNSFVISLATDKRKKLKEDLSKAEELSKTSKSFKKEIPQMLRKFGEETYDLGLQYVEIIEYTREAMHSLHFMIEPAYKHVDNNHLPISAQHTEILNEVSTEVSKYIDRVNQAIVKADYKFAPEIIDNSAEIIETIMKWRKKHLKTFKKNPGSTRTNILVLDILNETKNMILNINNTFKSFRDFDKQYKAAEINKI